MPQYTYTLSTDYINELAFDYMETYSFQRGNKVVNYDPSSFQQEIEIRNEEQELIYEKGKWHESRQKTNVFRKDEPVVLRLIAILQTEVREVPAWICAPFYRDAIVFYNNAHEIVSTLNVCVSCQYMAIAPFHNINADEATYRSLKQFFIDIGHKVEEN